MLLSEKYANSLKEIRQCMEDEFPNMTNKELFSLINILYKYQTEFEQTRATVYERNGVGFSPTDAKQLTSFHAWYLKKHFYTIKQKEYIIVLLRKHCMQLIRHWLAVGKIIKIGHNKYYWLSKQERLQREHDIELPIKPIQTNFLNDLDKN